MAYETISLDIADDIARLRLNRPEALNAMNPAFWQEMVDAFAAIDESAARVTLLDAAGRHFTAGLDLKAFAEIGLDREGDIGRKAERTRRQILEMQESFSVIERARMPVIAAVHGACIGGGIDLISACDFRLCTDDAFFSIHEINIGMAADVGTLQRLPHVMPAGLVRELAYTGRRMGAEEARSCGLVNATFATREAMEARCMELARQIADKSPVALAGTKEMLTYARDHSVTDGLNYIATWNAAMLQSVDLGEAIAAQTQNREATFAALEAPPRFVKRRV